MQCAAYIAIYTSASASASAIARGKYFYSIACWVANRSWPALKPVGSFQLLIIGVTGFKAGRSTLM